MENGTIALILAGIGTAFLVFEKLFGGGNALANKFHKLDKDTTTAISDLRKEMLERVDRYEGQAGQGFQSLSANVHLIEKGFLEFRARMAEEYVRRDDNRLMFVDFKSEIHRQFEDVKEQLKEGGKRMGRIEDLVLSLRASETE